MQAGPSKIETQFNADDLKATTAILAPCNASVKPLSEHPRALVRDGFFGDGLMFIPYGYQFFSPVNGVLTHFTQTCHQLTIRSSHGLRLHIEFGIGIERLMSCGFKVKVKQGQKLKAGQLLFEFDLAYLQNQQADLRSFISITNSKHLGSIYPFYHEVRAVDDAIMNIKAQAK